MKRWRWWRSARLLAAFCFGTPAGIWLLVALYGGGLPALAMAIGIAAAGGYVINLMPNEAEW